MNPLQENSLLRRSARVLSVSLAITLAYSAAAIGLNPAVNEAGKAAQSVFRQPMSPYAGKPGKPPVVKGIGRDPVFRGGLWNPQTLKALDHVRREDMRRAPVSESDLILSLAPMILPSVVSQTEPEGEGAGTLPGEGEYGGGSSGSTVNTNTGNRREIEPIVSWSARGNIGVDFHLIHNSKGAYQFDLGKGWSHSYNARIYNNSFMGVAVLRYPNGLEVPFNTTGPYAYQAPVGITDILDPKIGGGWTLTTKSQMVMTFDSGGFLIEVKDRDGNAVTINRNTINKITSISDGLGRNLNFAYNSDGRINQVTGPDSKVWQVTYNTSGQMTEIKYPELNYVVHKRIFGYNSNSDITAETNLRGHTWTYLYDASERLTQAVNPLTQPTSYTYGSVNVTHLVNGNSIHHTYSNGLLIGQRDTAGFWEYMGHDPNRNVNHYTDKEGKIWLATYDGKSNLLTETNPLGKTTTYTYDSNNDLRKIKDPLGFEDEFHYSGGRLTSIEDGLNRTTVTLGYNNFGEPTSATDALGRVATVAYDTHGNVKEAVAPGGVTSRAEYDTYGRVKKTIDPLNHEHTVLYDDWGRVKEVVAPGGAKSTINYDLEGNITSATDPEFRTGFRTIDALGRVTVATNAKGESHTYQYNNVGFLNQITNGRGFTRSFIRTPRGEVFRLTHADGTMEFWTYDNNGQVKSYQNGAGQTINYGYDNAGRHTLVDYPAGVDTTFGYDDADRMTSMVDSTGTSSFTYNAADEVLQQVTPQGTINYTYNTAGQPLTMTEVGVGTTTNTYHPTNGRLTQIQDAFGDLTAFSYDSAGRISHRWLQNGTFDQFTYDNRNRVTSIVTKNSSNATLHSRTYTFNLASEVTRIVEGTVTTDYTYDNAGQLQSEVKSTGYAASYSYDGNGNRLTRNVNGAVESYSYDAGDKLTAIVGGADPRTFTYDGAGRTTGIVRSSGTTSFTYDYESRVTSISKPGMTTNSMTYNGLDTRVGMTDSTGSRTFRRAGIGVTSPVLSDGSASFTPSGENRAGVKTAYHGGLKSFDTQTNAAQAVVGQRLTDAFGNQISSSGVWKGRFAYGGPYGYQEDPDTGLRLLGHRYYDSSTGRFLTRDPIKDGRNWYVYCDSNPISFSDPSGLERGGMHDVGDWWSSELEKGDITVPPAPPGANLWKDVEHALRGGSAPGGQLSIAELLALYSNKGRWDFGFHVGTDEAQAYGNFHFGVIMAAMGMTLIDTVHLAGLAEFKSRRGKVPNSWGSPFGSFPYGDDPEDQFWIIMGWWYYHHYMKPKQKKNDQQPVRILGGARR